MEIEVTGGGSLDGTGLVLAAPKPPKDLFMPVTTVNELLAVPVERRVIRCEHYELTMKDSGPVYRFIGYCER